MPIIAANRARLDLRLTETLYLKLCNQARIEGISPQQLVREILDQALVNVKVASREVP